MSKKKVLGPKAVLRFVDGVFGEDMHVKRVESLRDASLGVIRGASLAVHMIGQGLAQAKELTRKHCVKQVDRLLSNSKLDVWDLFADWVPYIIGSSKSAHVAMDWTEFDNDNQSTIMLSLVTGKNRAIPLVWKTVKKDSLKGMRNNYEDDVLHRLKETLPEGIKVTILADRGFGDGKLYKMLSTLLGFDYVIRFRKNMYVTDNKGVKRKAKEWVGSGGRAKTLRNAMVTNLNEPVPTGVCVQQKGMKDVWCIAASEAGAKAGKIIKYYGTRWEIETTFRDIKDFRFGMGMSHMHTKSEARRDRLFLISAMTIVLLTVLGEAGETVGLEKHFKANTYKGRTFSLFRQGCLYYDFLPGMREEWADPLIKKFHELLSTYDLFTKLLGIEDKK